MIAVLARSSGRALAIAALCTLLADAAGARPQREYALQEQHHLATVRFERERRLRELWRDAGPDLRAQAKRILRGGRDPHAPERHSADFLTLSLASRALSENPEARALVRWQYLADSLDLRAVPGAFEARTEGRGESVTVSLSPLYETWAEGVIDVVLFWIGPDGEEEQARIEPVNAPAFARGFPMYVRPPESEEARWHLVAELRTPVGVIRTIAVPVDCVSRLKARLEALRGSEDLEAKRLLDRSRALLATGARSADVLPLYHRLAEVEGGSSRSPLRLLRSDALDALGAEVWELAPRTGVERREAVLLLAATGEHPTDLLGPAVQEAWRASPRASRRRVLAAALPPAARGRGAVAELARILEAGLEVDHLTVVLTGENSAIVPATLAGVEDHGVDALVMAASSAARSAPRAALSIPVLQIVDDADEASEERGGGPDTTPWLRLSIPEPRLLAPLEFPARIDDWIGEE